MRQSASLETARRLQARSAPVLTTRARERENRISARTVHSSYVSQENTRPEVITQFHHRHWSAKLREFLDPIDARGARPPTPPRALAPEFVAASREFSRADVRHAPGWASDCSRGGNGACVGAGARTRPLHGVRRSAGSMRRAIMVNTNRPMVRGPVGLLLLLACAAPLQAQTTITVNTTADDLAIDGSCSLREAVIAANTNQAVDSCPAGGPDQDRIVLPPGTYVLSLTGPAENATQTGDLDVLASISLTGADPATTIIDGGSHTDPLTADRVIEVRQSGSLLLSGVTIRGGRCFAGAGILNAGGLYTYNVRVEANVTNETPALLCQGGPSTGGGAGILNEGRLVLTWAVVAGNRALGTTTISDAQSSGGGLLNRGLAQVQNATFQGNFAAGGGGIYNEAAILMMSSHIRGNSSRFMGGGLQNNGIATITYSTISHNSDGGILNGESWSTRTGTLSLQNSTVSHNEGLRAPGGIVNLQGEVKIGSSTIAGNTYVLFGAGLGGGGPIYLVNTIVANGGAGNCERPVESWGYNLDTDGSCGLAAPGDLPNTDPGLGPLADNGGPTPTHALLPGSPAIDWIPLARCRLHRTQYDQRFVPRPQPIGGACDIGAYERSPDDVEDGAGIE
jgi:CSLREA domain-containing protein